MPNIKWRIAIIILHLIITASYAYLIFVEDMDKRKMFSYVAIGAAHVGLAYMEFVKIKNRNAGEKSEKGV